MQQSNKEWSKLIFKKAEASRAEQSKLALNMKNVYWAIDGVRTIGEIADEGMYELEDFVALVRQLVELGFVYNTEQQLDCVEQATFQFISDLLSDQLGPMSEIVLEDAVHKLGYKKSNLPKNLLSKLIDALALEMGDAEKAKKLKATVLKEVSSTKGSRGS